MLKKVAENYFLIIVLEEAKTIKMNEHIVADNSVYISVTKPFKTRAVLGHEPL